MLYVVATPIGNLEDITLRALRVLREADLVLAEDTRRTGHLLQHHGVGRPDALLSCHEHNESERVGRVLDALAAGRTVALVTDAGTPGISDPGYRVVHAALDAGHRVIPIPGACAGVAALSASGLPSDRFTFCGFPPKKAGARQRWLDELATAPGTLILYVAARDVPAVLDDLRLTRRDPPVVVFREITKQFEEQLRGTASAVSASWREAPRKGEVVVLAGRPAEHGFEDADLIGLLRDMPIEDVASVTGASRSRLYKLRLGLRAAPRAADTEQPGPDPV